MGVPIVVVLVVIAMGVPSVIMRAVMVVATGMRIVARRNVVARRVLPVAVIRI
jgi:hypothetical protein